MSEKSTEDNEKNCPECSYSTSTTKGLNIHLKKKHNSRKSPNLPKNLQQILQHCYQQLGDHTDSRHCFMMSSRAPSQHPRSSLLNAMSDMVPNATLHATSDSLSHLLPVYAAGRLRSPGNLRPQMQWANATNSDGTFLDPADRTNFPCTRGSYAAPAPTATARTVASPTSTTEPATMKSLPSNGNPTLPGPFDAPSGNKEQLASLAQRNHGSVERPVVITDGEDAEERPRSRREPLPEASDFTELSFIRAEASGSRLTKRTDQGSHYEVAPSPACLTSIGDPNGEFRPMSKGLLENLWPSFFADLSCIKSDDLKSAERFLSLLGKCVVLDYNPTSAWALVLRCAVCQKPICGMRDMEDHMREHVSQMDRTSSKFL